ncbi:hypothetical protein PAMA_013995 [Pampus argenteus]
MMLNLKVNLLNSLKQLKHALRYLPLDFEEDAVIISWSVCTGLLPADSVALLPATLRTVSVECRDALLCRSACIELTEAAETCTQLNLLTNFDELETDFMLFLTGGGLTCLRKDNTSQCPDIWCRDGFSNMTEVFQLQVSLNQLNLLLCCLLLCARFWPDLINMEAPSTTLCCKH